MKIKDLDRNEVYSLEEIKKDSAKFDLLKEWLKKNDGDWDDKNIEFLNDEDCIVYSIYHNVWDISSVKDNKPTKCALTLFEPLNEIDLVEKIVNNDWIQSDFGQYKLTEQGIVFHKDFDLELYKELGGLSNKKPIEQSKPSQYQIGIDTFTRAESNMTKDEILACVRFNIDKYTWRKKGQDKEDFEKIISYAQWGLKQLK